MVRDLFLDAQFQEAARNCDRLRDMSLPPFVAFADVDQHCAWLFDHLVRLIDIDLLNRGARLVENILRSLGHLFAPFHSLRRYQPRSRRKLVLS